MGSAGFRGDGRKQHGRQGGKKASGGGEARAGPQREVEAETQMEGRTEGWRSGQEKAFREPKKTVNRGNATKVSGPGKLGKCEAKQVSLPQDLSEPLM